MKDAKKAEIKRVLLGRAVLAEDGRLIAVPAGTFMKTPIGIGDGATAVRLLGIKRRTRRYKTKEGESRVTRAVTKAMQDVGRGLILNEQPEAIACLVRYILTRPAVLVFTLEEGVPTLTAWTGRGLTGWISLRRAIRAFEKGLPETMTASDYKPHKEKKKKPSKEEKQEKKHKKSKELQSEQIAQNTETKQPPHEEPAETETERPPEEAADETKTEWLLEEERTEAETES